MSEHRPLSLRLGTFISPAFVLGLGSVLVLVLVSWTSTPAWDPSAFSPSETAPKQLNSSDSRRIQELAKTIEQLQRSGQFAEAVAPAQEALAICEQGLGPGHWQTADARRAIADLSRTASLPEAGRNALSSTWKLWDRAMDAESHGRKTAAEADRRQVVAIRRQWFGEDHPDTATSYDALALNLTSQAKHAAAEPLYQKALAIRLKVLGEEHRKTGTSYHLLGLNLSTQRKYAAAEPLYQKALAICLKLAGEDHLDTALSYKNLAYILNAQGKYATAEPHYQKALAINLKVLGEAHRSTAMSYNHLAYNLNAQGKYAAAEPLYQKALVINLQVLGEHHPDTATIYNNLALNLTSEGKYAAAEPLYQKALAINLQVLGEHHSDTATIYNNLARNLNAQGKYAAAEPLYQKTLATLLNVLGEDNPKTATTYNNLALNLDSQGKYAAAEPHYRKALAIRRRVLGEDHPETGANYNNIARNLDFQGNYATAEPYYQTALAIDLKVLGEDHPETATMYDNLARNLNSQGKYAAAELLCQKALASRRKMLGEDHPHTGETYASLAHNLDDQGKCTAAEPHYQKALAINLKVLGENHPATAVSYNNLAVNLNAQGKYTAADLLCRKALAIDLKVLGEDHPGTAVGYNNLARNLNDQGWYAAAEPLHQQALAISMKVLGEDHPGTATVYASLARNLNDQGKYAAAEPHYRRALAIRLNLFGKIHPDIALSYNNLAANLQAQGKYAIAQPLCQDALAIRLQVLGKDHPDTGTSYNNLAFALDELGRSPEAIKYWTVAAEISERTRLARSPSGLERAVEGSVGVQGGRLALAVALAHQGDFIGAWSHSESSLARGVLDDFSARHLRPLTVEERQLESELVVQLQQLDKQTGRLAAKSGRNQAEDQGLEELRRRNRELRGRFVALEIELDERYRAFAGHPANLSEVREALQGHTAIVGWVDVGGSRETYRSTRPRHWACIVRSDADPIWVKLAGSGTEGAWTEDDRDRPMALRGALVANQPSWRDLAAALASQRLEPLRPHLEGISRLIVLPSPTLAGIPIEVLVAAWPEARGRFVVSYAPSASMLAQLRRPRSQGATPSQVLALGDPAYPPAAPDSPAPQPPEQGIAVLAVLPNSAADLFGIKPGDVLLAYNGIALKSVADLKEVPVEAGGQRVPVKLWRNGEVRSIEVAAGALGIRSDPKRPVAEIVLAQRAADEVLKPLTRGAALEPLPGTRREVETIASLFPADQVTTLLGSQATEHAVQDRALSGNLKDYRFLHFATHGKSNPNVAMSSALMLAPEPDRSASADPTALETDGEITADQIVQTWDLDADLVVLSACETGLGKYAGGEGYLGFAQALFVKGARSIVLSQWKVPDHATTLLMTRFYGNLLGRRAGLSHPLPKAEALHEAKEWLRGLSVADAEVEMKRLKLDPAAATRGERKAAPAAAVSSRAFEHPYYWAGFILIGNPD